MNRIATVLLVTAVVLASAGFAVAQDRDSQLRTVRGQVLSKDDNSISGAVVYLRNLRTQTVKTYISDDAGNYRFSGLDPNVDYEVHAEHENQTSARRTLSSFDSRKEIVINLKVDRKKG
ncbi:MAG TPA: carboxypeptidase-like regulatory domain-containing protein [Candidatus Acidoferrales bacterium]|nr:carboxypeptidase-like regulatory domain-containing protein [Candidatus Acidoferrales bacterium]